MGWVIFLAIAVPLLAVLAWVVFNDSLVQIAPGQLGLLLVRGKATDRSLDPGPHWVPAVRRRMVQTYPSLELSLRTAPTATPSMAAPIVSTVLRRPQNTNAGSTASVFAHRPQRTLGTKIARLTPPARTKRR